MNDSTLAGIFRWQPACFLRVSGDDSATFLQGQFTNDLRGNAAGGVYGLWLNVKGKVVADSFALRGNDSNEFWIGSYFSPAATIRERLESHVIADDVVIEDQTAAWSAITIFSLDLTRAEAARLNAPEIGVVESFLFRGRRDRGEHFEWIFPRAKSDAARSQFPGSTEFDQSVINRRRIEAGIPAVPVDIGSADLPNEGGLDADAISYTKGCYLGQEVMARLRSMGRVRRRLIRVTGAAQACPALPAPLFAGATQVGQLRSAATTEEGEIVGMAMLTLVQLQPNIMLSFTPDGAPTFRLLDTP